MAFAIKYYGEFTDIPGRARARGNLITVLGGIDYATWTSAGTTVTSAVNSSGGPVFALSDGFSIQSGDSVIITTSLTLNSGEAPYVKLVYIVSGVGIFDLSSAVQLSAGANSITLTATDTKTAYLEIYNTADSNFALTEVSVLNDQPHDWKIDILEDGFAGVASEMQMSGSPLSIEWPSTSDDLHEQNVRGSVASIGVFATTDFQYQDLFTSENLQYKVNIYNGSLLFWTGWVTANAWTEPYAVIPYPITISATDGLGTLKDFEFDDLTMTRRTAAKVIYDILSSVGFTEFTEYINVYDIEMDVDVDDSPLDQVEVYTWVFEDMTKYEALETLLKTFNAGIIQSMGEMIVYRYNELGDDLMYGRKFTDATTKTAVTYTPLQYINRTGYASYFEDAGQGTLSVIPKISKFTILQDYGSRESILRNHVFNYKDFPSTANTLAGWERYDDCKFEPLFTTQGEEDGILINETDTPISGGSPLEDKRYIYQTLSGSLADAGGKIRVKFDYGFINSNTVSETATMFMAVGASSYNSGAIVTPRGWSGWTTIEGEQSCPVGDITVKLWAGRNAGQYIKTAFRNIEIKFVTASNQDYDEVNYEVLNATYGQIKELEYVLGDGPALIKNIALQYNGGLTVGGVGTSSWDRRGGSENDILAELIGGEIGGQFNRPKHLLDISLYETGDTNLKLFGRIEDNLNQYLGNNRKFAVIRAMFDAKNRFWDLSLNEGISTESLYLLDDSGDTITNDADELIEITAY
jgi:hypothetical protein